MGNLGSTGSAFLLVITSRFRDGWQWPACAVDGDVPMVCSYSPRGFLLEKCHLFPSHTASSPVASINRHALVSSHPSTAVPVLSLGDRVSRMLSSQGTAVRHRLAGSLSPTRLLFSRQRGVASDSISSEDRLKLGCGPLQMPAKNMEIPMRAKMGDSRHLPSHT